MIKKYFYSAILILVFSSFIFAQLVPKDFHLKSKAKVLSKTSASPTPLGNGISDIVVVGDTIIIGTGKGLSISTDNGDSWENYYQTNNFGTDAIASVNYNKYTNTIWASTVRPFNSDVDMGTGIHYSTDLGKTWNYISQPVDAPGDSLLTYGINDGIHVARVRALPVTVPQLNISWDFAFTPGTIWIASYGAGLRKSTDNGQNWQRVLLPSDSLNSLKPTDTVRFSLQAQAGKFGNEEYLNHRAFSVISTNDSTLYAGTANGINKSSDGGISWVKFNHQNQDNPISGNFITALGYNSYNNTIWGATWVAEGSTEFYGVSYTSDGGQNWQTALKDEHVHNFGFKNNDVIANSDNGAFRSSDKGVSWILPNSIVDSKSGFSIDVGKVAFNAAGSINDFVWLGSDEGLARLDEAPNIMWDGEWKIYFASQSLASQNETHCFPNPFSPRLDRLKIKYSTGGKSAKVTIRVFNFSMNYVATVIQNADRSETGTGTGIIDYWDGRDASGNMVPNGVYFYRVEVGSDDPVYGKIMVIQ